MFVSVSDTTSTNAIMTSTDGINWYTKTTPSSAYSGFAWSPTLNCAAVMSQSSTIIRTIL